MAAGKQKWSVADTTFLIETLRELNIIQRLDGRKARNSELYSQVHLKMQEAGINRSIDQIKNRWKSLKAAYYKAKSQNGKSGSDPASFEFYEQMDEMMGNRPLSTLSINGVDVGMENDEDSNLEFLGEDGNITDESSTEVSDSSMTQQIPTETDDSCSLTSTERGPSRKRPRERTSGYAKAMRSWATDQQVFLEKMQESQNKWIEEQQEKRLQREERLMTRFIEESTLANQRLVGQIFDGLKSIFPPTPTPPQGMAPGHHYHPQHHNPGYSGSAHFPHNTRNYGDNYSSDYHLHDLD